MTDIEQLIGRRQVLLGLAGLTLAGCAGGQNPRLNALATANSDPLAPLRLFADSGPDSWAEHLPARRSTRGPNVLALSGGGEDGAFGAGALVGLSAAGRRPDFDIVTGISTGALIAPFAFVGQTHDSDLGRIFTEHDASDIMRLRPIQAVFSDALYDAAPLERLIGDFTPPSFIDAVAARHKQGGRLFVVTSELDTAKASIWNMGAIAEAGQYPLFRAIMRASTAIPGLFSPVDLSYTDGIMNFHETHVDGGVQMQFLTIPDFAFTSPNQKRPAGHIYLVINNTLNPVPVAVTRSALAISQQAMTTMVRANALSAVNSTRLYARQRGLGFSLASIDPGAGIAYDQTDRFSTDYMNEVYRHGYRRATEGTLWNGV